MPPGGKEIEHAQTPFARRLSLLKKRGSEVMSKLEPNVLEEVKAAAPEGRLTCAKAHELAEKLQVSLLAIGQAADELGIKIKNCRLGCF